MSRPRPRLGREAASATLGTKRVSVVKTDVGGFCFFLFLSNNECQDIDVGPPRFCGWLFMGGSFYSTGIF